MQINNFRVIDSNSKLVQIELERSLDFNTLVSITSYIFNGDDNYSRQSVNATDEDIEMVRKALSDKIDLDSMIKKIKGKESIDPEVAKELSGLEDIRKESEENKKYTQKMNDNYNTLINSDIPKISELTDKKTSILNNQESIADFIKKEIEQRKKDSLRNLLEQNKQQEEMKEDITNNDELESKATDNSFNSIIQELKDSGYRNIYISGPIRGIGYDAAKRSFRAFAIMLEKEGFIVNHTFANLYPNNRSKEYYIKNGIIRMMQCDAVLRFNTQVISEGANVEKEVAKVIGIPYFETNVACVIM